MEEEDLKAFLYGANANGYAGGEAKSWATEPDGSTTIAYRQGPWAMHDNFFGGEPYGGREVVFHDGRAAWMLVYYGRVTERSEPGRIYALLRRALAQMPADAPFRGPPRYDEGPLSYRNAWEGDLSELSGAEEILDAGQVVYTATYAGGWVDRRAAV